VKAEKEKLYNGRHAVKNKNWYDRQCYKST